MKYIDVHAHLDMDRFNDDLDEVVVRAKENDCFIVSSGTNPSANRKVLEFSKKYENVLASFGIYPIDGIIREFPSLQDDGPREIISFDVDEELKWIEEHKDECVLIGEIGLDFKVVEATPEIREAQIKNFEKIIEFAKRIDKTILIHTRGAELECIELLEKHNCKKVIMHCFSGKKALIRRIVENGWFLSVPAVITRLDHFKMLVAMTPLEQILTETDSPYLSPVTRERNEPVNVMITVKEIAKIKELDEEVVKEKIVENTEKLLNL